MKGLKDQYHIIKFLVTDLKLFIKEDDVLLADRSFNIQDVADEMKIKLYIPPFLCGRKKLTAEKEVLTKKLAKTRIHIERAIGRLTKFRILSTRIPILLMPILSMRGNQNQKKKKNH